VYAVAAKYGLQNLKSLALEKLEQKLKDNWRSDTYADCAREVYILASRDDAIRTAVIKIAVAHVHDLVADAKFKELFREGGDFVCDYIEELHRSPISSYSI
jgi:hypothetical protein